jgi:hypothetical protein
MMNYIQNPNHSPHHSTTPPHHQSSNTPAIENHTTIVTTNLPVQCRLNSRPPIPVEARSPPLHSTWTHQSTPVRGKIITYSIPGTRKKAGSTKSEPVASIRFPNWREGAGETRRETKGRTERRREAGAEIGLLGKRREVAATQHLISIHSASR